MMKQKQIIRLTEYDIHNMIKESIRQIMSGGSKKSIYDITFISYGLDAFDYSKFRVPTFRAVNNKPRGGFWASPLDSRYGWSKYCLQTDFQKENLSKYVLFRLKKDAKIYIIDSKEDMDVIATDSEYSDKELDIITNDFFDNNPQYDRNNEKTFSMVKNVLRKTNRPTPLKVMDFNYLYNNYDGVFVTENAANALQYMKGNMGLRSWDVESICIFNPDIIEFIDEKDKRHAYYDDKLSRKWVDGDSNEEWMNDADKELDKMFHQDMKNKLDSRWQDTLDYKKADEKPLHRKDSLNREI